MKKKFIAGTLFLFILGIDTFANEGVQKVKGMYDEYCGSCHNGGFKGWMTGAPKTGKLKKWKPFFDTGLEEMTKNVITGEKKHEIKGGCDICTDADILSINEYIISITQ